ncbi:Adenylate kinase 2 [Microbotryomycetes sp. JL201]|nr:Adenylate kinase 2 [Microbotryomycetes sp. JL201]
MIILGAPGAGKGQDDVYNDIDLMITRLTPGVEWDIESVVVGDLLRQETRKGTALGRQAESVMKAGGLLPDELVLQLVKPQLEKLQHSNWILDGFPRKASQAVLLDRLLAEQKDELNYVVNLEVPDEVILERIEQRWIHAPSGRVYNLSFNPPREAGKDDVTGEPLSQRPDDTAVRSPALDEHIGGELIQLPQARASTWTYERRNHAEARRITQFAVSLASEAIERAQK